MSALVVSGAVFDLVIAVLILEGLVLVVGALAGRTWLRDMGGFVLAGLGLAVAARAALVEAQWGIVAAGLVVAFAAHVYDLARRVRRSRPVP
ncbi:hypothetical protein [Salinarimonas sp.]|uniref:hypothetical protein n=1 Tax=Salinarimonas sp. TaxID=2766526 RepID=UPI00391D7D97